MRVAQNEKTCVRATRVGAVGPVHIDKRLERVTVLLLEVKTPVHCPVKEPKDLHGGGVVSQARALQELRELANSKRDVGASKDAEVVERTNKSAIVDVKCEKLRLIRFGGFGKTGFWIKRT